MTAAQLCVTVTAPDTAELRRRRDDAVRQGADLVELRLDSVHDLNVPGALAGRLGPVIVTCRPSWEGGQFTGAEEERRRVLAEALALGAEYVDIEWRAGFDELLAHAERPAQGSRVVLSYHEFGPMPDDLDDRLRMLLGRGPHVVKVAVTPPSLASCVTLRDLARQLAAPERLVLVGMGDFGLTTRILPNLFGSRWTYAGDQVQVGQLSASALLGTYRFRALNDSTELYGIVGLPVSHSVSPAMHNAAFAALGLNAVYLPLPAVTAEDFVTFGRAFAVRGASVTIPHKISLLGQLDEVQATARTIGAINTIKAVASRWIGANSDVEGFLRPLRGRVPLAGTRAAVLGAGGAARAVTLALAGSGAHVSLHARRSEQAEAIARSAGAQTGPYPPSPGSWDLLVNTTPVGMFPVVDETPIDARLLKGGCVYDLVYNPPVTRLLREAAEAGCETIGGLEMLVGQAEAQFQWWTGQQPPPGVLMQAALERLSEFARHEHHLV